MKPSVFSTFFRMFGFLQYLTQHSFSMITQKLIKFNVYSGEAESKMPILEKDILRFLRLINIFANIYKIYLINMCHTF